MEERVKGPSCHVSQLLNAEVDEDTGIGFLFLREKDRNLPLMVAYDNLLPGDH